MFQINSLCTKIYFPLQLSVCTTVETVKITDVSEDFRVTSFFTATPTKDVVTPKRQYPCTVSPLFCTRPKHLTRNLNRRENVIYLLICFVVGAEKKYMIYLIYLRLSRRDGETVGRHVETWRHYKATPCQNPEDHRVLKSNSLQKALLTAVFWVHKGSVKKEKFSSSLSQLIRTATHPKRIT
jgi:hypothetical protein